jgi:NACalpha-BTF3-like transcription factor
VNEEDIKSYMQQFKVDRITAIKELDEIFKDCCEVQEAAIQEVYNDIIRSSH